MAESSLAAVAPPTTWEPGPVPVAVVMIALNEGHNMQAVCDNLCGWAHEVFLIDSYSKDDTVDIALRNGIHVVQRKFTDFGDQWNFALEKLPITAPWTIKLDPDERLDDALKRSIHRLVSAGGYDGIEVTRQLCFMGRRLPVSQRLLRVWRTGTCRFTDVAVNEHPVVAGSLALAGGFLDHHDSPSLEHWVEKQNRYTTAEAVIAYRGAALGDTPRLVGTSFQRRMWLKRNFSRIPFRFFLFFLYNWLWLGAWRAGWVGYSWARLRSEVMRMIEYKRRECEITGRVPAPTPYGAGEPDLRVPQF
jgi:hypothetical protein